MPHPPSAASVSRTQVRRAWLGSARFAAVLVAASEGAVVLSRADQSLEPFDLVAEQLIDQVRRVRRL
jgi:hypothetical protein